MPIMVDAELWRESGRIDAYGKELVRFDDRHGREFVLGPTHEETVTALVRNELRSYKQLPVNLYHIQDKFRDEFRPRFGLMRGREFIMKDAYSFSATQESLQEEYDKMKQAYANICERSRSLISLNMRFSEPPPSHERVMMDCFSGAMESAICSIRSA